MNAITRRLLGAVIRKLLPDAVQPDSGSALAIRPTDAPLILRPNKRSAAPYPPRPNYYEEDALQTIYADPPAPRRRRRIVVVEQTTWEE